jgi:hypothetical protein
MGVGMSLIGPSKSISEVLMCDSAGIGVSAGDSDSAGGGVGCCLGGLNVVSLWSSG